MYTKQYFSSKNDFLNYGKISINFDEIGLIYDIISYIYRNLINLHIVYKLDAWSRDLNLDFILGSCLFGAVKLTGNKDSN